MNPQVQSTEFELTSDLNLNSGVELISDFELGSELELFSDPLNFSAHWDKSAVNLQLPMTCHFDDWIRISCGCPHPECRMAVAVHQKELP